MTALDVSLARLAPFGDRCIRVQGSALNVVNQAAHFGPYDLVVAGGLFDYLNDALAIRLLREVYRRCVAEDGTFVNLCLRASVPRDGIYVKRDGTRLAGVIEIRKPSLGS
jgi:hypothetical protein